MSDISNISNNNNTQHSPLALKMQAWQGDCELFAREVFAFRPTAQQSMIFKSVSKCNSKVIVKSGHGCGKELCNSLIVNSLQNKMRWGDVKVGDKLFGLNGLPTKVLAVYPQGYKDIYKIILDDKTYTFAGKEHLWSVEDRDIRRNHKTGYKTLSTAQIMKIGVKRMNGVAMSNQFRLPQNSPVDYANPMPQPINSYVFGVWLGDGDTVGRLTITSNDVLQRFRDLDINYSIRVDRHCFSVNPFIVDKLGMLDLKGCHSYEKYIPDVYKYSSIDDRWELLRGLLDANGTVSKNGSITYCSTSRQLIDDVVWVVRSLGLKCIIQDAIKHPYYSKDGVKIYCRDAYNVTIGADNTNKLFYIKKKQDRVKKKELRYLTRWIESIEYAGQEECTCVTVDAEDSLYLINDFIPTHNTAVASIIGIWHTVCFADARTAVTAPSSSQLKDAFMTELRKWVDKSVPFIKDAINILSMRLELKDSNNFLSARTADDRKPDALQGFHADNMMFIIDECFGVSNAVYEVAMGSLTSQNSRCLLIGNPTDPSGFPAKCCESERWESITLSCLDSKLVSREYIEDMGQEYGVDSDVYKVRVLGEFPSAASDQFISNQIVDIAQSRKIHLSQYDFAPIVIGVDVSYFGDDRSVIFLRQGLTSTLLYQGYNIDTQTLAGLVAQYEIDKRAEVVFVDMIGVGAGVIDRLKRIGRNPIGVNFNGTAIKTIYKNKRAECWGDMKDWLIEGGSIPINDDLKKDLISPHYFYNPLGKIQLERKEDMKKRRIRSPDLADALALTFAMPVHKREGVQIYSNEPDRVQTDYDLFK